MAGALPQLHKEIGLGIADTMTKTERFNFRHAIERMQLHELANENPKMHPNLDLLAIFAEGIADTDKPIDPFKLAEREYMRSVPSFLAYKKVNKFISSLPVLTNAPIEVVKLYCDSEDKMFDEDTLTEYGRYDIIKWMKETQEKEWVPSIPADELFRPIIHPDLSPEAIDSVYRSTFSTIDTARMNNYARHIAYALRMDALQYITNKRHPLNIAVGDMGLDETMKAMAWALRMGKPWRHVGKTLNIDMYTSINTIKWLDEHGCPWDEFDWMGVFFEMNDTNFEVVKYLFEREVPIPEGHFPNVRRDTMREWYEKQLLRWKEQLSSLENYNNIETPHNFSLSLLMKAPTEVARLQLQREPYTRQELLQYSRYDLVNNVDDFHVVRIDAQQTIDLSGDTLFHIYDAVKDKNCFEFIITLMSHGRTDVLERMLIFNRRAFNNISIFCGRYENITVAEKTIRWAMRNKIPWGPRPLHSDPLLESLYTAMNAPAFGAIQEEDDDA